MIRKEEWDAAYRELIAEGQKRAGPPPTFEEVEALSLGTLSEPEAERVREVLSHYPDLLRVVIEPFPEDARGVLTDFELAADLAKIRARVQRVSTDPLPRRRSFRVFAIAAGIVILIVMGSAVVRRLMREPRAVVAQVLYPEGYRGGEHRGPSGSPVRLTTDIDYTLQPAFSSRRRYPDYRVELLDLGSTPPRRVWLREHVAPQPDGTYPVPLMTEDLDPGLYRLVLYGVNGTGAAERLAEYMIRLSAP